MADSKDTIYVDIDDEIIAIIDKVTSSKNKIVALVLPKRATALQSQVNMKLLRRAADDTNKNLVLVTSESGLMPLAGAAGIHVAKTPTSKPEIPQAPAADEPVEDIDEPDSVPGEAFDARANEQKPLSEVAGLDSAAALGDEDNDTIELDNSDKTPIPTAKTDKPKIGKDKKKKIPNFNRFRTGLLIAALVIIGLGVLAYFAFHVWPHATISIYTKQTSVPVSFTMNMSADTSQVDAPDSILPATVETSQKSYSQTVAASGQKDEGTPASGTITMTAVECGGSFGNAPDVPAGTGVSTNNLTYITQADTSFGFDHFKGGCGYFTANNSTPITAQNPGTNYNVGSATFQVSGRSDVSGTGSASGGTSNVVRVVQQSDIDSAKQQLASQNSSAIKQKLISQLQQAGLTPLTSTFSSNASNVSSSANPGDQADNVTVTENVTYLMYGYRTAQLEKLISAYTSQQVDLSKQGILDYGIAGASFKLNGQPTTSSANVAFSTNVIVGPKLDVSKIKTQVEGKKAGDVRSELSSYGGVSKVQVDLSPFWVGSVPKNPSKIDIKFVKS